MLEQLPNMDWSSWFDELINVLPDEVADDTHVRNPAYITDLVYDTIFRVPEDGCPPLTCGPPPDMIRFLQITFNLDNYQATFMCEQLYRWCGRWTIGVPSQLPRDQTNYMLLAPVLNEHEANAISETLFLGHADYVPCFSSLIAHVHGTPPGEPVKLLRKWCIAHPHYDEHAVAMESQARAAVVQVLRQFSSMRHIRVHVSYTPTFINSNPYYIIELLLDSHNTHFAHSLL